MIEMVRIRSSVALAAIFMVLGAGACADKDKHSVATPFAGAGGDGGAGAADRASAGNAGASDEDLTAAFFAADHVVQVKIDIESSDWDALRSEGRTLIHAMVERGYAYEYTYFDADVTIDGTLYEDVGIRKKGFIGSLSLYRPSVKLDLDRNVAEQSHSGIKKLTLNNNRQDISNARQCVTYRLFSKAGLPAPRCNLARVFVNGEDLGIYTNLEPVDKAMLGHYFEDPEGNLYEGQAADFDRETVDSFERKTNKELADRSDLERVVEALERPDDEVVEALSEVVDLDSFRTFWAMEALVGHWDSYSGNANNFYVYHDPTSDLFYFIPWGTDGALDGLAPFDPERDITVFASGKIANRLYGLPQERQRYRERLAELVDSVWDAAELDAQLDEIAELAPESSETVLETERTFIQTRAENMRAVLAEPASGWTGAGIVPGTGEATACQWMTSDLEVEFNTYWGEPPADAPAGVFNVEMSLDGEEQQFAWSGSAGVDTYSGSAPSLQMMAFLPDERMLLLNVALAPNTMKPGTWPFHAFETYGMMLLMNGPEFGILSYVSDGEIVFEEASTEAGAPVVGRLSATILQLECLNP